MYPLRPSMTFVYSLFSSPVVFDCPLDWDVSLLVDVPSLDVVPLCVVGESVVFVLVFSDSLCESPAFARKLLFWIFCCGKRLSLACVSVDDVPLSVLKLSVFCVLDVVPSANVLVVPVLSDSVVLVCVFSLDLTASSRSVSAVVLKWSYSSRVEL